MSKCIDRRDLTTQNRLALPTGPTVDSNGVYTFEQISVFQQEIADSLAKDAEKNPIQLAVNRYGDSFYEAANFVNTSLKRGIDDLGNYPDLGRRWDRGNISNLEFADFINRYNYSPNAVINIGDYQTLARQLDNYYKDTYSTSILGGLCKTLPQIFGAVDAFFDVIDTIADIISDIVSFVNKVRSYDSIQQFVEEEIVKELINQIQTKIIDVIKEVFREIREAIDNFNIEDVISEVTNFNKQTVKAIMTEKEQMCVVLSKDNEQRVLDRVKNFINYAISLLESPGLEQVQYVIARICALATNIEALIRDIKSPLDDYSLQYQRVIRRVQNIGKINTSTAIRNGAIRYSPEARKERINSLTSLWEGENGQVRITPSGKEPNPIKPITVKEYKNMPKCGDVIAGNDKRVGVSGAWVDPKELGPQGYSRIDLDVKVYLMRVQAQLAGGSVKFNIVNGWRSKVYNDKIGGDESSSHLSGLVIDIENNGFDVEEFTDLALKSGFKHVVIYDDHIHLDIREMTR